MGISLLIILLIPTGDLFYSAHKVLPLRLFPDSRALMSKENKDSLSTFQTVDRINSGEVGIGKSCRGL